MKNCIVFSLDVVYLALTIISRFH